MPCIGAGVQRFQFKEHKVAIRGRQAQAKSTSPPEGSFGSFAGDPSESSSSSLIRWASGALAETGDSAAAASATAYDSTAMMLREPASSPALLISQEFMQALRTDDLRYDLNVYGFFLQGVPRRLGQSRTLDASAYAVTKTLAAYQRGDVTCPRALASYGAALGALRTALADPATASTADTLCSIYLIVITQGWIAPGDFNLLKHSEAIAFILKKASSMEFQGEWENWLVITLLVPVIIDAIMNPKIVIGSWLDRILDKYLSGPYADQFKGVYESCHIRSIARLPTVLKDPVRHIAYVAVAFEMVQRDVALMHIQYAQIRAGYEAGASSHQQARRNLRAYGLMQTAVGIVLMVANLYAGMLAAHDPDNATVVEAAALYRREALALSRDAAIHRPLGTSYMTMMLIPAWAASEDPEEMAELWAAIEDYAADFPQEPWQKRPLWLRGVYDALRANRLARASGSPTPAQELVVQDEYCTVM